MSKHGDVIVLNQSNAINLNSYNKERKQLTQGALWHKIIIHDVADLDREIVLRALLNHVHPLDLIPVNYKVEGKNAHFIARNCGAAIEKLCRDNLIVQNPGGQPYLLTIVLGFSNTTDTQLNIQSNIAEAIKKRFDSKSWIIDLDNFHKDPALSEVIFCVLSQPKILHFVLQLCKPLRPRSLKLSNNELRSINAIEVLWSCLSLASLDLRNNLLDNMICLSALKNMQVKELWLDGNPLCQTYGEVGYIDAVREVCPTITKLDGVLLGTEGFLAYRRNFAVDFKADSFVDQFLDHFFTLYDSSYRSLLISMYHQKAIFSLSTSHISDQITSISTRCGPYKQLSRNLLKLVDLSKTADKLDVGPANIKQKFEALPFTEHDPFTFTVDVLQFSEKKAVLCVTGAFREPVDNLKDADSLYCFCRTFVLTASGNGEYKIINDLLHVSNATTTLANRSFKHVKTSKYKIQARFSQVLNETDKQDYVETLSNITGLTKEWSKRCLEEAKWNLQSALVIFVDFYKLDKIPTNAFIKRTN